jgi:hypothetical protein
MRNAPSKPARVAALTAAVLAAGAVFGPAQANTLFLPSPSLPLIGTPYQSTGAGAGCFNLAGACVTPGPFVQTSATSSFMGGNQFIMANATYGANLTPIKGNNIIGSVSLTGTLDEEVLNRMSDTETGSFTTDITSIDLHGPLSLPGNPLDGDTLHLKLTPQTTSSGTTTIMADGSVFQITSFFDVFVDVTLTNSMGETLGGASLSEITLIAVPEPSTWALLVVGFAGLGLAGYRAAKTASPMI